jgi:hypothetical protein
LFSAGQLLENRCERNVSEQIFETLSWHAAMADVALNQHAANVLVIR